MKPLHNPKLWVLLTAFILQPRWRKQFHQNNTLNDSVGFALGSTTAEALAPYFSHYHGTQPTVEHLIVAVKKHLTHKL